MLKWIIWQRGRGEDAAHSQRRGFHIGGIADARTLHFDTLEPSIGVDAKLVLGAVMLPVGTLINV